MTQHLHAEFVLGCYRCDLRRGEEAHAMRENERIVDAAYEYVTARQNLEAPTGSPLEAQILVDAAYAELLAACGVTE